MTGESPFGMTGESPFGERYEVLETLGQGGMGTVLKARHTNLSKTVAIKVLNAAVVVDKTSRSRFEQEALAGSKLSHPNLVAVFDYGFMPTHEPYLVMEYIEGESLEQYLEKRRRLDFATFRQIFAQVCKALQYVHKHDIVHRDIKTSNIMLQRFEDDLHVKLLDFGIAKVLDSGANAQNLTATGSVFGSPMYMSPEQCMGQKTDARSDIYSLGCVMYECLTGFPPFKGENALQTLFAHVNETIAPMDVHVATDADGKIVSTVQKCLEKDPAKRFQSAAELLSALSAGESVTASGAHAASGEPFLRAQKETGTQRWSQRPSVTGENESHTKASAQSLKHTIKQFDSLPIESQDIKTAAAHNDRLPDPSGANTGKFVATGLAMLVLIPCLYFGFNFVQTQLSGSSIAGTMKQAESKFSLGPEHWNDARQQYESMLSNANLDDETKGRIASRLGMIYLRDGKFQTAGTHFQQAENILKPRMENSKPYYLNAVFGMGQVLAGQQAGPRAEDRFAQARTLAERWEEREKYADILVASATNLKDRDLHQANAFYDQAIKIYTDLPNKPDAKLAMALIASTEALGRSERSAEAGPRAKQAVALANLLVDARLKARILADAQKYEVAQEQTNFGTPATSISTPPNTVSQTAATTATAPTAEASTSAANGAALDQMRLARQGLQFSTELAAEQERNFKAVTKKLESLRRAQPAYNTAEGQQLGDYQNTHYPQILRRMRQQSDAMERLNH